MSAADRLRLFVERIERLTEERKGINDDIRDVFSEAKSDGFDATAIRAVIKRRLMDPQQRLEADAILETYEIALGMTGPIDMGELTAEDLPRLPAPQPKLSNKMAEADAWANGDIG